VTLIPSNSPLSNEQFLKIGLKKSCFYFYKLCNQFHTNHEHVKPVQVNFLLISDLQPTSHLAKSEGTLSEANLPTAQLIQYHSKTTGEFQEKLAGSPGNLKMSCSTRHFSPNLT
jgi:hypothetical protein